MAARQPAPERTLDRFVFGWTAPEETLSRLRSSFPDISFEMATGDDFNKALPGADAAIAWSMTEVEYAAASRLQWFQSIGAGVESVLLPGMRERGLILTNTSGIHATNISEHVLAMMLAFARRLPSLLEGQRAGEWRDGSDIRGSVFELSGQTLLVVGFGEIGQELARKANALGMRVLAIRRNPSQESPVFVDLIGGLDQLPFWLTDADHVAICLPQTHKTTRLFDAPMLEHMTAGAYLYNIGRGPVVDTDALVAALDRDHLAGAGLDVTDPEPLPGDSPLWQDPRVIITSHTAGSTPHFWNRITDILVDNIARFRAGQPLINVIDFDAGY